jgi:hypothetical protein
MESEGSVEPCAHHETTRTVGSALGQFASDHIRDAATAEPDLLAAGALPCHRPAFLADWGDSRLAVGENPDLP